MSKFFNAKRVTALSMSILMATTLMLSGCGKDSASGDTSISSQTSGSEATNTQKEELKPYEIVWNTIGTPMKDTEMVFQEVSKYTKEKFNATVKMNIFDWSKYEEKMQVIVQSGEQYDIAFTCSWALPYEQMVAKNAFLPVDDLLEKHGKGIKEILSPLFLEGNKVKGKLYAVPNNKELSPQNVFTFNKKLVEKYNMDVSKVKTLQDLEPLMETIKKNEKDIVDIFGADAGVYHQVDYVLGASPAFVIPYDSTDGKIVNMYDIPKVKEDTKTLNKFYKAGYLRKDIATFEGMDRTKSDKWFVYEGTWLPGSDESTWNKQGITPVVSVPQFEKTYITNNHISGSMLGISVTSQDPERVMMFLNLLNTDKYLRNLVDSGIENVHYKMENGKQVDLQQGIDNYNMSSFSLGNVFLLNLTPEEPDDKWEQYKKLNDSALKSPILGFKANIDGIKKEIAAFENIQKEFVNLMANGVIEIDEILPKYMDKMNAAGYEKVKAELQKQLDDWKATQK